jgi:hypothetical protein
LNIKNTKKLSMHSGKKRVRPLGIEPRISYLQPVKTNHCATQRLSFIQLLFILLCRLDMVIYKTNPPLPPSRRITFPASSPTSLAPPHPPPRRILLPQHPHPAASSSRRTPSMCSEHALRQQRDARGCFASAVAHAPEATAALGIPSTVDPTPQATAALGIPSAVNPTPEATAALGIPSAVDPTPEAITGGGGGSTLQPTARLRLARAGLSPPPSVP